MSDSLDRGHLLEVAVEAARRNLEGLSGALRLQADYERIPDRAQLYRQVVRLPELIAVKDRLRFQFVLDEFQELARFDAFKVIKQAFGSIYALLREEWQQQRGCNYVVSGSAVSMLHQILNDPSAPLFQHFTPLTLGPLPHRAALGLLAGFSQRSGRPIPEPLCQQILELVGTNPYYLQVFGEELMLEEEGDTVTLESWKATCQRVLFSSSGRLYQYFERLHLQVAGSSSMLDQILVALATGPKRGTEIARSLGVTQNRLSSKLPLLERQDVVVKEGPIYRLEDPCYALWLQAARTPAPNVVAPLVLGDESERRVAREIGRQGVGLVYQSRASRGAFDLLALYQAHEIAVQVKRIQGFPAYVPEREMGRMRQDSRQLGWHAVMAFDCQGQVSFHPLSAGVETKRGWSFREESALRHLLDVVDLAREGAGR